MLTKFWGMCRRRRIGVSLESAATSEILLLLRGASHFAPHMSMPSTPNTNRPIFVQILYVCFQDPYRLDTSLGTIVIKLSEMGRQTLRHESATLTIWLFSQLSHPPTAQLYAFWLNQSNSFNENMFPLLLSRAFRRISSAFLAAFIIRWIHRMYTSFKLTA